MTNAWALLYDELNMTDNYEHTPDYYDRDRNRDSKEWESIVNGTHPEYELTADGFVWPKANDLNLEALSRNGFWKYEEDKTMKEVREYLSSTYKSHYTSQESKTQTLDLIESIGDSEPFCRSNAIKYLSRFGKKNGKSKQDILKAIHYCILLYHFAGLHNETKGTYETF